MTPKEQLFETCHELTEFCMVHAGKCLEGWSREKIFAHVCQNILEKQVYIVKVGSEMKSVAIVKKTSKGVFIDWCLGSRDTCRQMFRSVMQRFPDTRRFFAYHHDKFQELDERSILRFCGGQI
jgi:hypothetical protein